MAVTTLTREFTSPVPASKMFKGSFLDAHNLLPKIGFIKSIEGEGVQGSETKITFIEDGKEKYIKNRIDVLDAENYYFKQTAIEGEGIGDKIEKVVYEIKFVASGNGGSVWKLTAHHHAKAGVEISEEELKASDEKGVGLFKAVEGYLIAHPDAYA